MLARAYGQESKLFKGATSRELGIWVLYWYMELSMDSQQPIKESVDNEGLQSIDKGFQNLLI